MNIKPSFISILISTFITCHLGLVWLWAQEPEQETQVPAQAADSEQAKLSPTSTGSEVSNPAIEEVPTPTSEAPPKPVARKQKQLQDSVKVLQQRWHQAMRILKHSSAPAPLLDAKGRPLPNNPHASISVALEQVLEQFRYMPELKLRSFLNKKFALRKDTQWLNNHPRMVHLFAKLLRSKTALPQLFSIMEKREKMIQYSLWILGTFVLSFLLRHWIRKAHPRFLVRLLSGLVLFIFFNSLRIGLFVYQFYPELSPTIELARQV